MLSVAMKHDQEVANDVIAATASLTSYVLHLAEVISGRGAALVVLRERFPRAVREIFGG